MSSDPLPPNPAGAWVTAGPTHNRVGELAPDVDLHRPTLTIARSMLWGLASLLLGIPLFVGAPIQLQLNRNLWTMGPHGMNLPGAFIAGLFSFLMILGLAGSGVFFGIRGWLLAVRERQTIALGLAGTLLNAATLLIWLWIGIDLLIFFVQHMR
jgi:hypothetical protein